MRASLRIGMNSLVTVAGVAALLLSPLAAQANSDAITYPRAGEVCDQVGQVCYDSFGPSIGITKIYFGQFAADRLSQNLSRSSSRDFRLSSGQACSISMRTCWNDGWNAQNKDKRLTWQLFASAPAQPQPHAHKQVAKQNGFCSLSEAGRPMFDGPCDLKQVVKGNTSRFRIHLSNGNTYVFDVAFDDELRGRDVFDLVTAAADTIEDLTFDFTVISYSFGDFLTGITLNDDSDFGEEIGRAHV